MRRAKRGGQADAGTDGGPTAFQAFHRPHAAAWRRFSYSNATWLAQTLRVTHLT